MALEGGSGLTISVCWRRLCCGALVLSSERGLFAFQPRQLLLEVKIGILVNFPDERQLLKGQGWANEFSLIGLRLLLSDTPRSTNSLLAPDARFLPDVANCSKLGSNLATF